MVRSRPPLTAMYARVSNQKVPFDREDIVTQLGKGVERLRQQPGFVFFSSSYDHDGGVLGVLSVWTTPEDYRASLGATNAARSVALAALGGEVVDEPRMYELVFSEMGDAVPGSQLMLLPATLDPAAVEAVLGAFRDTVLPDLRQMEGFLGVQQLVDRATGDGLTGTLWTDAATREKAWEETAPVRAAMAARGVLFGEPSRREMIFAYRN